MSGRPATRGLRSFAAGLLLILPLVCGLGAPAGAVDIQRVVSPGGITAWLVRDSSVPLLSIEFSFRGGYAADPPEKAGIANLVSGLLDEGAGDLDSAAFQKRLENRSIRLGFAAGTDTFRGSLKFLNRDRDEAIRLLTLALTKPRFDAEPVERIRQQILVSLKRRAADPDYVAGRVWATAVYGSHPYGRPADGTAKTIAGITRDDLVALVRQRFARDRLIVGVTGDITPQALGPLLDAAFGGLPATSTVPPIPQATPALKGDTYVVDMDVPQSAIVFGQPGLHRNDPEWYTALVMNYILGGGSFSSRLYREVRDKRGLAYSVGSSLHPLKHAALISGGAGTRNDGVAESLRIIRAEWQRMRDGGVTDAELAQAKTYLTGSFPLRLSSTDQIARMLVSIQYYDLGIDYLTKRASHINAVTREAIARLAQRLLDPKKLTFVVVGKPAGVTPTAKTPQI